MFKSIRPLHDRVLVKRSKEQEEKTASGIIIPGSTKEKAQTGIVVAVGPGNRDANGKIIAMSVKKDDSIFFGKFSGTDAGDDHIILREDDILGIIEK